jgi:hypothetical protein
VTARAGWEQAGGRRWAGFAATAGVLYCKKLRAGD